MQSKLPDLNNYWIKYHDIGMFAIKNGDFTGAIASIYSMNALLPDEYRIEVDSDKFNQLTRSELTYVCEYCDEQTIHDKISLFNYLTPYVIEITTGSKSIKGWNCPKCKKFNELQHTKFVKKQNANPFYYKVIPDPPMVIDGISRREKKRLTIDWYYRALEELDHQLGLYRKEYEPEEDRDDVTEWAE